jgi:hypothetical protein
MRQLMVMFPTSWRGEAALIGDVIEIEEHEEELAGWLERSGAARPLRAVERPIAEPPPAAAAPVEEESPFPSPDNFRVPSPASQNVGRRRRPGAN